MNRVDPKQVQAVGEVILNSIKRRTYRRGQQGCGGWLNSPATLDMFALTLQRLLEHAQARKVDLGPEQKVTMLRAMRKVGDTRIWIFPTNWDDPQGIPIKSKPGKWWANLYDFMAEAGLLVATGHSERYILQDSLPDDPPGEYALWFDVAAPAERKLNSKGRAQARTKAEKEAAKARAAARAAARAKAEAETAAADEPKTE